MSISSPLDIAWDHAYWCEGPRFQARGYTGGASVSLVPDEMAAGTSGVGGWTVGSISIGPAPSMPANSDLQQLTSTKQPIYRSSSASFNSKPILEFDGVDDAISTIAAWSALAIPNYFFLVARTRASARDPANAGSFRAFASANHSGSQMSAMIGQDDPASGALASNYMHSNGTLVRTTKAADTLAHAFYLETVNGGGTGSDFQIDGVSFGGVVGSRTSDGAILGAADNLSANNWCACDVAFYGIKDTAFSGTELADLLSWSQSHYSTP